MRYKPSWSSMLTKINVLFNEDSIEFKEELNALKLEMETIPINYNSKIFLSYFLGHLDQVKACYLFIDKGVYKRTSVLLKAAGIGGSLDDICSLLKQAYYKSILMSINSKKSERRIKFNKDFSKLVKILNQNITSIRVQTNIKGTDFTTDNSDLIDLILRAFKDKIKGHLMLARQLLIDADLKTDSINELSPTLADDIIFNLVLYIHTKTDYKGNQPTKDIQTTKKISNRLCELVYNLVDTIGLMSDKIKSPSKDIIRLRFIRYADKHPSLLAFFDKDFDEKKGLMFYPEDKYFQKYMDYSNLINELQ